MNEEAPKPKKMDRIKKHFGDHKTTYLAGAGCLVAGYFLRPQVVSVVDSFNIKYRSPVTNNITIILERRACREPIPVLDKLTGESFASINRAAAVTGETARDIAKDVHGVAQRFEQLPDSVLA